MDTNQIIELIKQTFEAWKTNDANIQLGTKDEECRISFQNHLTQQAVSVTIPKEVLDTATIEDIKL